jgi:hypothetical protein
MVGFFCVFLQRGEKTMQHKKSGRKKEAQLIAELESINHNNNSQKKRLLAYAKGIKQLAQEKEVSR